jgi:flagellar hook protein FlgE
MGVFGAMLTAVSGLRSQSYALENISGNIANSQTTGFKRVDTSFVDLIPDLPYRREIAGSVTAFSRSTNTIQGDFQNTSVSTHVALNGQGYFIVGQRSDYQNGQPVFTAQDLYTRRGDFDLDKDGYLVNGSGYYLKGNTIDPVTGQIVGSAGAPIRVSDQPIPAQQTANIEYRANLPSYPRTNNSNTTVPQSELLNPATYTVDPVATGTVIGSDIPLFLNDSIAGGSITIYNSVGAPVNVQMRWAKTDSALYGGTDTWQLYYQTNSTAAGAAVGWQRMRTDTFNNLGQITSPTTVAVPAVTVDTVLVGAVNINTGASGLTQFSDVNGVVQAAYIRQDGYAAGSLDRIAVGQDGRISGTYTNGQVQALAQIGIANFSADNALKRGDGGVFAQTLESGDPVVGIAGATVLGGTLENSNTDIAEEFTKMIITQQAYTANTRVVTTAQQMLQEVINIVR